MQSIARTAAVHHNAISTPTPRTLRAVYSRTGFENCTGPSNSALGPVRMPRQFSPVFFPPIVFCVGPPTVLQSLQPVFWDQLRGKNGVKLFSANASGPLGRHVFGAYWGPF